MAFAGILSDADVTAALQACQGNLHVLSYSWKKKPTWLSFLRGSGRMLGTESLSHYSFSWMDKNWDCHST